MGISEGRALTPFLRGKKEYMHIFGVNKKKVNHIYIMHLPESRHFKDQKDIRAVM